MGAWSQYSEEWEKQRAERILAEMEAARQEFERKPRAYKAAMRFIGTVRYYWSFVCVHIRRLFDRHYREEMEALLERDVIKTMAEILKDKE